MNNTIFLQNENGIVPLNETKYDTEDLFQELIENYPSILAGDQITPDDPRKWILISREMGIPSENGGSACWSLDHLFIDQDGIPTLVEVKRSTDTRIRREVVGQMLDYAANATAYWKVEELQELYKGDLCSSFDFDEDQKATYWDIVESNLRSGKIRLMFVADSIPDTLRCIIEFLNSQMNNTEVLGLEIKQFLSSDNHRILVPNLIGRTLQAVDLKKTYQTKQWNYDSFLNVVKSVDPSSYALTKRIIDDMTEFGCRIYYGKGAKYPAIVIIADLPDKSLKMQFLYIYASLQTNTVGAEVYFNCLKRPYETTEARLQLKREFENIFSISIPDDSVNRQPRIPYEALKNESIYQAFFGKIKEMVDLFITYRN